MNSSLLSDLGRIVGPGAVSIDTSQLDRFGGDALGVYRAFSAAPCLDATAGVLVSPSKTDEVSRVLRFAQRHSVPVVPYGGGTGVMGAAAPVLGCIVLNMQRMSSILDISAVGPNRVPAAGSRSRERRAVPRRRRPRPGPRPLEQARRHGRRRHLDGRRRVHCRQARLNGGAGAGSRSCSSRR